MHRGDGGGVYWVGAVMELREWVLFAAILFSVVMVAVFLGGEQANPAQLSTSPVDGVLATIQAEEGFRGDPYRDTEGALTVGYGTKLPLSEAEATYLARARLHGKQDALVDAEPWTGGLPLQTREALLNMAYQMGVNGLERFADMLSALQDGDCDSAKAEALDSEWARQTPARAASVAARLC